MTYWEDTLNALEAQKLLPVIRTVSPDDALWTAEQLIQEGFEILEITSTIPDAFSVLNTLRQRFKHIQFGAGTILTKTMAQTAFDAGASFLVSPIYSPEVMAAGEILNILTIPGASTPTEIVQASQAGAPIVKVFPIHTLGGASYIKSIRGPFPSIKLMVTGSVTPKEIPDFLNTHVNVIGIGGHLAPLTTISKRDHRELQKRSRQFVKAVQSYQVK